MAIEKLTVTTAPEKAPSPDKSSQLDIIDKAAKFELPWSKPEKKLPINKPIDKIQTLSPILPTVPAWQVQRAQAIDKILSEGLNEIFLKMKPDQQAEFKIKGEETVSKINFLLNQTKIKVEKIISLIRNWLKLVPGINHFFVEQEAKIKADRIIALKDKF